LANVIAGPLLRRVACAHSSHALKDLFLRQIRFKDRIEVFIGVTRLGTYPAERVDALTSAHAKRHAPAVALGTLWRRQWLYRPTPVNLYKPQLSHCAIAAGAATLGGNSFPAGIVNDRAAALAHEHFGEHFCVDLDRIEQNEPIRAIQDAIVQRWSKILRPSASIDLRLSKSTG
jgi:hypothetical protein